MKNIIIYGAAGHGKVLAEVIKLTNAYRITGFVDNAVPVGTMVGEYSVIGSELSTALIERHRLEGYILAIGANHTRQLLHQRLLQSLPGMELIRAIHPAAVVSTTAKIERGAAVLAGAIVNCEARVGIGCIVNTAATLDHESVMEDFSSLLPGAHVAGNVRIGETACICMGASVIQNTSIGKGCVVGAGAVVTASLSDMSVAFGIPAKRIRERAWDEKYI